MGIHDRNETSRTPRGQQHERKTTRGRTRETSMFCEAASCSFSTANRRPGVATTMCGLCASAASCRHVKSSHYTTRELTSTETGVRGVRHSVRSDGNNPRPSTLNSRCTCSTTQTGSSQGKRTIRYQQVRELVQSQVPRLRPAASPLRLHLSPSDCRTFAGASAAQRPRFFLYP